jgi:hypothetical protein
LFGYFAVGVNCQHAVGEDEVARLKSARQCADDASSDYQLSAGYRIERSACGFSCATMPDAVTDDRKLLAVDLRAEAMQAVQSEWSTLVLAALERRDLARECIEEKNQLRDLTLAFRRDA